MPHSIQAQDLLAMFDQIEDKSATVVVRHEAGRDPKTQRPALSGSLDILRVFKTGPREWAIVVEQPPRFRDGEVQE